MSNRITTSWNIALNRDYSPRDILLLAFAFLCLNIITTCIAAMNGLGYPYDSFLFFPADRFADFFKIMDALNVTNTWDGSNPYVVGINLDLYALPFDTAYYFVFAKLIGLVGNKYLVYWTWIFALMASSAWLIKRRGHGNGIVFLIIASYPMIFVIDRGNIALVVFVLLLLTLTVENIWVAAFAIALATSIKIIPVIFIIPVMLMAPWSFKRVATLLVAFVIFFLAINLISIKIIESQLTTEVFSLSGFSNMTKFFYKEDLSNLRGLPFGSSLYLPLVYFAQILDYSSLFLHYVQPAFLPIAILGPVGIYLLVRYDFKGLLRQYLTFDKVVFIACYSFVLFPPVSCDYYLTILFLPLIVFPGVRYSFWYFVFYGMLLGAKHFVFLENTVISLQSFVNPLLLLTLTIGEFGVLSFIRRDVGTQRAVEYSKRHFSKKLRILARVIAVTAVVLIAAVGVVIYYKVQKDIEQARKFAAAFRSKEWFYSVDGGNSWVDRTEGGLKEFDDNGNPIHVDPVWGKGRWVNANLIQWISVIGSESWWGAVSELSKRQYSEEYVKKAGNFAKRFHLKAWFYSVDAGATWTDKAEGGLKGFDENGNPVHKDAVWATGEWLSENRIHWLASNGTESLWQADSLNAALAPDEKEMYLRFAKTFTTKTWYYSVDDGKNYSDRAESGLKGFDDDGRPIHIDPVWGKGRWKDENTIEWAAINGSKSIWKAR